MNNGENGVWVRGSFTFIECLVDIGGAFPRDYELVYKCGTDDEEVIETWDKDDVEDEELKEFINWIKEGR
jgi:hypothetical protein